MEIYFILKIKNKLCSKINKVLFYMNCDCLYCFENNRENTLYGYIVGVKRFPFLKFKWIYVNKDKCGHMDFFKMDKDSIYYKENYEPKLCKFEFEK